MINPELLKAIKRTWEMADDSRCQEDEDDLALVGKFLKDNGVI